MNEPAKPKTASSEPVQPAPFWFTLFTVLLVLLPLPFGSNRPWASDLFGVLTGLLIVGMLWKQKLGPILAGAPPLKRLFFAGMGLTAFILWSFVQVAPWTPESLHHPIWSEAAQLLGPVKGSISVDPGTFTESLVRLLGYICCFLLAFVGGRDRNNAKRLVRTLAVAGFGYALYGIVAQSTGSETILWYKKWAYEGFLTSTFVNKNSYAIYAGMGLLCTLAMIWENVKRLHIHDPVLARQSQLAALFDSLRAKHFLLLLPPLILLAALALTGSRAGVASVLIGVIGLFLTVSINRRIGIVKWLTLAGILIGLFVLFVSIGGDALMTRLSSANLDHDTDLRLAGYRLIKQAILDNPWLGFGLGSFETAFRLYRDSSLPLWFQHAHNDYLELAMDAGLPAATVFLASLVLLVSCCLGGVWTRKRGAIYPCLAVAATLLVAAHAFVDFSMQIPAIAATYAALLGLGVAQSWSSRNKDTLRE